MTHRVVVVGGGFCGAMAALHLRRDHPDLPVAVTVVEERASLGAGLAYGTNDPACRINVAASRMSPFEEAPSAFDDWLAEGGADPTDASMIGPGGRFPLRAVFARYVAALVAERGIHHRRARAVSAGRSGAGWSLALDDGATLTAETLVLATGHPRPVLPRALRGLADDGRVVRDPWDEAALARVADRRDGTVLLVGTGLTSCDVLASLRCRGHRGTIVAVSRRGLLPRPRTTLPVSAFGAFAEAPSTSALALVRRVRAAVAGAAVLGRPWEDVITALREQAPIVWRALPCVEQRRLLAHARAFWDVHRFQCAPQIAELVQQERAAGRFVLHAASLRHVSASGQALTIVASERGSGAALQLRTDWVVNCTGPGHADMLGGSPLLASLHEQGWLRQDPLGLGLETDFSNHAVGADGVAVPSLFVAGPPARAAHGELMGLPQVSRQPREVASRIAAGVRQAARPAAMAD